MTMVRGFLVLAVLAGLAGCDTPLPGQGVRSFALYDGAVRVRGPEGFCIDPASSRPDTGFAVLGACGIVAATGIMPVSDGFITVQVGGAGTAAVTGSEDALAALLRTRQGAALLNEAGRPETISLGQIDRGAGLVSVQFSDSGPPPVEGLADDEWRAFLDVDGRLTTIGVRSYTRAPLTSGQAQTLLYATVAALRAANGTGATGTGN